jgi:hypothetical protein
MKKRSSYLIFSLILLFLGMSDVYSQGRLLRRIQEEAEKKAIEEIFGKEEEKAKQSGGDDIDPVTGRNRRGTGLSQSVPDVALHIDEARSSYVSRNYTASKSALRQALWGVELEMGKNVLESLPESVGSLKVDAESDRVSSTGIGFVGLVIERRYSGGDDMELAVSVGSDSGLFGIAGLAAASGMYAQSTDETNHKQIRFQDHNAYISYDDYDGYMLSVPFGQSSVFILRGINYDTETEFMSSAANFNILTIKQKLGEQ